MASHPIATREARKNPGVNVPLASLLETVAFVSFLNPCFFSRLASPPYVIPALFSSALRYREALSAHSASVIGTHTPSLVVALAAAGYQNCGALWQHRMKEGEDGDQKCNRADPNDRANRRIEPSVAIRAR